MTILDENKIQLLDTVIRRGPTLFEDLQLLWLSETYKSTDTTLAENLAKCYILYLRNKLSAEVFYRLEDDCKIVFREVDKQNNQFYVTGAFIKKENLQKIGIDKDYLFVFETNTFTKESLSTSDSLLKKFLHKITEITTHEDTHKQQYKQYKDYDKNYIEPVDNDFSWDYYNQKIEADAFGRQVGKTLRNYFPESNICDILGFIKTNKVPDLELQTILNIYSSEKVNKTSRKKFFRAMYDYLIGEEA